MECRFRISGLNMTRYFLGERKSKYTQSPTQCRVSTPQSADLSNVGFRSELASVIFYSQLSHPKIKLGSNYGKISARYFSARRAKSCGVLVLQRTSIWLMQLENPVIMAHPSTWAQNIGLPAWNYHVNVCKSQAFYIDLDNWLQSCDLS